MNSSTLIFSCDIDDAHVEYRQADALKEWGCTCYRYPRTTAPGPKCEHVEIAYDIWFRRRNNKPDRVRNECWFDAESHGTPSVR